MNRSCQRAFTNFVELFKLFSVWVLAAMFTRPAVACWRARVWAVKSSLWSAQTAASQTLLWEHWGQEGRSGALVLVLVWWPSWVFPHDAVGAPLSSAKQVRYTHTHLYSNCCCLKTHLFCCSVSLKVEHAIYGQWDSFFCIFDISEHSV